MPNVSAGSTDPGSTLGLRRQLLALGYGMAGLIHPDSTQLPREPFLIAPVVQKLQQAYRSSRNTADASIPR
jgi:hypothetical protein